MDLGTMKRKLERGAYAIVSEFEDDFEKLQIACKQYNLRDPSHPGYKDGRYYLKLAAVLQKEFKKRWDAFLETVAAQQAAAVSKANKKLARGSSSAASGGGGSVKLALGGAQVSAGMGGKKSRPAHLRNAAYWRGDEGVARAVRARVEAEEAEGKQLGGRGAGDGGRGGRGWRPNRRDILLANRHRESEPEATASAAAGAVGGAAKSAAASSAAAGAGAAATGAGGADGGNGNGPSGGGGPRAVDDLTRTASLGSVL
jgi:hypothetical protein